SSQSFTLNATAGTTIRTIIATGGAGDDTFNLGTHFSSATPIDGGAGNDTVTLDGDLSVTLNPATLLDVETLSLQGLHTYNLTMSDANVDAGQTLAVNVASANGTLHLDASTEVDGNYDVTAQNGGD